MLHARNCEKCTCLNMFRTAKLKERYHFEEVGIDGSSVDWINLAQDSDQH
jgi:hypothetical protein